MLQKLDIFDFLALTNSIPVADVRSPKEFDHGHIPGASNLPLFNNDERAEVGTIYKQIGRDPAIKLGLEIASTKFSSLVERSEIISPSKEILIHCWRGGMRSESVAAWLEQNGFKTHTLNQGYKAYRNYILEQFSNPARIIILGGMTGSGKTDILKELQSRGEQVIDLEAIAHHKGSAFGALGQETQPSTEQFQNDLFACWNKLNPEKRVWIEDESMAIGTVNLPVPFYLQMRAAPVIKIEIDRKLRAEHLVQGYGGYDKVVLKQIFHRISQRLGGQNVNEAIHSLENNDFYRAAEISLIYYDKAYQHGLSQRPKDKIFPISLNSSDPKLNAAEVMSFYKSNFVSSNR